MRFLSADMVILDGGGTLWRTFVVWKTPMVLSTNGEVRRLKRQQYYWMSAEEPEGLELPEWQSAHPPRDWTSVEFDDRDWTQSRGAQGPAYLAKNWQHPGFTMWTPGSPSEVQAVCSRAKFKVVDLSRVGGLQLCVWYQGGVVIYVNGRELVRQHLPQGPLDLNTLATPYPDDVYRRTDGSVIEGEATASSTPEELVQFGKRIRTLEVALPLEFLRAGVNVVAIEVHRAPYKEICSSEPKEYRGKKFRHWPWPWPHCRLLTVRLTGASGDGVVPNCARPVGVQVWTPHPWATVTGFDYGDPCESPRPLKLVGARNGAYSTQLVVSSGDSIRQLRARVTELTSAAGESIPTSSVLLRYPEPAGNRFDALLQAPPPIISTREYRQARASLAIKAALQPIWVTVIVPSTVKPGKYAGKIFVEAEELSPVEIPLTIKVHDWCLPDPRDFTVHNNFWQSHETVAARYGVPLWSDKHFALMGKCLELTGPLANKFCNVHLVAGAFCIGNSQSMVRWIEKGPNEYDYDFTVFDRYLDVYEKVLGKPKALLLDVCVPIHSSRRPKDGSCPVQVSRLEPATGKIEPMGQPALTPATAVPFWKPVLDRVKLRLEKRRWWDVTFIGTASDTGPTKEEALTFKEIWPDKSWLFSGHPDVKSVGNGVAPIGCLEWVWGAGRLWNPIPWYSPGTGEPYSGGSYLPAPWKREHLICVAFPRFGAGACELFMQSDLSEYRLKAEKAIQCGQNGIGRVGINFWEFTDDKGQKRQLGITSGQFSFNAAVAWILAAGPDGPLPTTRSEMFREGLQVCEAMLFLQRAADTGKLPADLAEQVKELLFQRAVNMIREAADGHRDWLEQEDRLFGLCEKAAEVLSPAW
ncbi:MAG: glycoside hydrolase domain-containing protein [Kiritimatiellia bacterium]